MTIEDKLREYILKRYKSLREFTIDIGMSYSTLSSILSRGVDGASVGNIIKICKGLNISVDALADGEIVPVNLYKKPTQIIIEVEDILDDVKEQLIHCDGLTFEGRPADKQSIESIIDTIDIGVEMVKRKAKL